MAGGNKNHSLKVKKRKAQQEATDRAARAAKANKWRRGDSSRN